MERVDTNKIFDRWLNLKHPENIIPTVFGIMEREYESDDEKRRKVAEKFFSILEKKISEIEKLEKEKSS